MLELQALLVLPYFLFIQRFALRLYQGIKTIFESV